MHGAKFWTAGLVLAAAALSIFFFVLRNSDFLTIDGCLDAGGRWNYEIRRCEPQREQKNLMTKQE